MLDSRPPSASTGVLGHDVLARMASGGLTGVGRLLSGAGDSLRKQVFEDLRVVNRSHALRRWGNNALHRSLERKRESESERESERE